MGGIVLPCQLILLVDLRMGRISLSSLDNIRQQAAEQIMHLSS